MKKVCVCVCDGIIAMTMMLPYTVGSMGTKWVLGQCSESFFPCRKAG